MHVSAGYQFWPGKRFKQHDLISDAGLLEDTGHEPTPNNKWAECFEAAITFPEIKLGGFPITIGLGTEKVSSEFGGYLDVEQTISGWLGEKYYGEYLVFITDIEAYSISGSINLKPYKPRHFFGYSVQVFSSIRYLDVLEIEDVMMQGNYHVNGATGQLEYQIERFQRSMPADKFALEVGGRLEWNASRFISLILPQITLRGTVFRQKVPTQVYASELDDDILEMPERKSGYFGMFLLTGIAIHL